MLNRLYWEHFKITLGSIGHNPKDEFEPEYYPLYFLYIKVYIPFAPFIGPKSREFKLVNSLSEFFFYGNDLLGNFQLIGPFFKLV